MIGFRVRFGLASASICVDSGSKHAKQKGETAERLFAVAAWRAAPYFDEAERAALALAEAVTRLPDRADTVPDEIWDEAAKHYDEKGLAALLLKAPGSASSAAPVTARGASCG